MEINVHLSVELRDDYTLIKCYANFDAQLAPEARKVFTEVIEHADRKVLLDLCMSNHMDSSGVGAIAFLYKRLNSLGFSLELVGLREQPFQLISMLHINDAISCHTVEDFNMKYSARTLDCNKTQHKEGLNGAEK